MANMIPDVRFPALTWTDLYTATGLPVGTPLLVVNKLQGDVVLWEGPGHPSGASVSDGLPLPQYAPARIMSGATGAWAYWNNTSASPAAQSRICVQEWQP